MRHLLLILSLVTLSFLIHCSHKSSPTEPQETSDLSVNMLLKPATENGYNVTRVHVKITRNTFTDSMDLTINGESASGTFTDLKVGVYQIEVWVYEDTTLIATGSGTGEVKAGQTVNVTINVTFLTGNLGVTVNWGSTTVEPNTIFFEVETGATVDLKGVNSIVNGKINDNNVEWEESLSSYNVPVASWIQPAEFPEDVKLVFKLSNQGKFSVKAYCITENYEHLFTILSFRKRCKAIDTRSPSDKWTKGSYYTNDVPYDFKDLKEYFFWDFLITRILQYEYGYLYEQGCTSGGPSHSIDFKYLCSKYSSLLNGLSFPISIVLSGIIHQQADYSWFPENEKKFAEWRNSHFSMAPKDVWDLNFSGKRYFDIEITNPKRICTFADAWNDNSNSSSIKINGTTVVSRTYCCGTEEFDFSTIPNKIEFNAYSVWSFIGPVITIITQADNVTVSNWHEERDGVVDPADSWDKNPKPLILKVDQNGTSIVN
ncbi:hypothetical protein Calab_0827 [Caldithrix abyssi DSM 13497]|uniref:Alkaline phosphatase n=1 Tax=Caldithrix abyssi DSM 13497 TaxID=880073 RepID=H1XU22_CALAY|nr:hypothetical protein [Caldithrix abyssi]APF16886.1 Alkaline phosphatase [Caldithrix abyssi DSM 13497]EHO40465.1 hypothetical protein Calab_0827 [Caldithrix abyssi DSM 13497]